MPERVLIVEDEDTLRQNLVRYLERLGYVVSSFPSAEDALLWLGAGRDSPDLSVAVIDLRLPGKDGITFAAELSSISPDTAMILMTAYGSVESVIDAMRAGAADYLLKPVLLKDVARKIERACEHRRLARENAKLRRLLAERCAPAEIVARSRRMVDLCAFARQIAASARAVLIEGESGSGKEVMARFIHDASGHREGPFIAVSMATIPEALVESSLFGQERGAGGDGAKREGLFRAASGGTLFLDDIGELSLASQAKVLRAIETREVLPVGADRTVRADARIIAATSADLAALVRDKRVRQDLYFRLSALRVEVPPLRRRPEDIPALAEIFLAQHKKEHGRAVTGIDAAAMQKLLTYPWPGNVRELSNVMERATLACAGKIITVGDLPVDVVGGAGAAGEEGDYHGVMADFERALLRSTLERTGGDRRECARVLGLSLATLYRRIEKLGLKEGDEGGHAREDEARV